MRGEEERARQRRSSPRLIAAVNDARIARGKEPFGWIKLAVSVHRVLRSAIECALARSFLRLLSSGFCFLGAYTMPFPRRSMPRGCRFRPCRMALHIRTDTPAHMYAHAPPQIYLEQFNDVTNGSNAGCSTAGFQMAPGWNPVTALGTLHFEGLLEQFLALL